ncbi:MAG: hypothetical protein RSC24_06280 [Clostridium sp.]
MKKEIIKDQAKQTIEKCKEIMSRYGQTMVDSFVENAKNKITLSIITQGDTVIKGIVLNDKLTAVKKFEKERSLSEEAWSKYNLTHTDTKYTKDILTGEDAVQIIFKDGKVDNLYINDCKNAKIEFDIRKANDEWNRLAFREFKLN